MGRNFSCAESAEAVSTMGSGDVNECASDSSSIATGINHHWFQSQHKQETVPQMTQLQSQSVYHAIVAQLICNVVAATKTDANPEGAS